MGHQGSCRLRRWVLLIMALFAATTLAWSSESMPVIEASMLPATLSNVAAGDVVSGRVDSQFVPFDYRAARQSGTPAWLRLRLAHSPSPERALAVVLETGRHLELRLFAAGDPSAVTLHRAAVLPSFRGVQFSAFLLPDSSASQSIVYARMTVLPIRGSEKFVASVMPLEVLLKRGDERGRMIALAFGALGAMSLAALLIWFVLKDKIFLLYAALFSLQALYIAYLSGYGFEWPFFSRALPLASHAWNIPAAVSGAVACWFVRELLDLKAFWPRVYRAYGWLGVAFLVVAAANVATEFGLGGTVAALGNVLFIGSAVFTLITAGLAWRRGNRAAGWFLIAWLLLETFTIATAANLLLAGGDGADLLLYYGLPLSMVAAAVLVALGVADRLRAQRDALSDAERRAQTDPLTGVLNRRSLIERLEIACLRAKARNLPIALLFIDLDHFKDINDTRGHQAGDACLKAIIPSIEAELRQSDVVGRYGGEEFIVILSSADTSAAHPIAKRIVERVGALNIQGFGAPIKLTCSIGVAGSDTLGVWGEQLIARADAAVYVAKNSGRNRVEVAVALAA
jgi:two-component system, sensor histidine kinase LadS